jgi:predicted nucleotide-binding protein
MSGGRTVIVRSPRDIFVVHGRDEPLRERFFDFLRALDLRPLDWEALVASTGQTAPSLITVIRAAMTKAQAIIVLLSPDDMVQLHPSLCVPREAAGELMPMMQPRPKVLRELGMALERRPDQTIVVEVGHLRPIADLGGLNVIHLDGSEIALGKVVQRLKLAGCDIDDSGSDWHASRRFADLAAHDRGPIRSTWRAKLRRLVRARR